MPEKPLWRDASGRLTFSVDGVEACDFADVCRRMADRFSLTPDGEPLAGPDQMFWRFQRGNLVVGADWDSMMGLTIVAETGESEPLVQEIGTWFKNRMPPSCPSCPRSVHGFVWGVTGLLVIALIAFLATGTGQGMWDQWAESRALRQPSYREQIIPSNVFRTRANTWSNLAYIVVGLYAIGLGWHDRQRVSPERAGYLMRTPSISWLFGLACCYLGIGSGLFHASLTRLGQQIDVASMYTPLLVVIAMNLGRSVPARWQTGVRGGVTQLGLTVLILAASLLLFIYKWSMSSFVVLTSLIAGVIGCVVIDQFRTSRMQERWLAGSTVTLVAAVVCRELDIAGRFSSPTSWAQGHAAWHLLTALSLASLYAYYRSETSN